MKNTKNNLMNEMTNYSVNEERMMCLINLATYMMGKINCCDGSVSSNEEINNNYSGWLESLLDTVSDMAKKQNAEFDSFIQKVNELE